MKGRPSKSKRGELAQLRLGGQRMSFEVSGNMCVPTASSLLGQINECVKLTNEQFVDGAKQDTTRSGESG